MKDVESALSVPFSTVKKIIKQAYYKRLPLYLWGPPGIGKSSLVKEVAREENLEVIDLRLTQIDPTDLRGLPKIEAKEVQWVPPSFLPKKGKGLLFLDELNLAVPAIQHAAYQLIQDRRIGDYTLPEGWVCIAAGNRTRDRANVRPLPAPLANRFIHVEVRPPSVEEWTEWALKNGIDTRIITFLNFRKDLLLNFQPDSREHAFPTPRSWELCSRLIEDFNFTKEEEEDILMMARAAVGTNAASHLLEYLTITTQIDAEKYLNNPEKASFPKNLSELYALCTVLADAVPFGSPRERVERLCILLNRLAEKHGEFALLCLRLRGTKIQELIDLPAAKQLAKRFAKYFLTS